MEQKSLLLANRRKMYATKHFFLHDLHFFMYQSPKHLIPTAWSLNLLAVHYPLEWFSHTIKNQFTYI